MIVVRPGVPLHEQGARQCQRCFQTFDLKLNICPVCKRKHDAWVAPAAESRRSVALATVASPPVPKKPTATPSSPRGAKVNKQAIVDPEELVPLPPQPESPEAEQRRGAASPRGRDSGASSPVTVPRTAKSEQALGPDKQQAELVQRAVRERQQKEKEEQGERKRAEKERREQEKEEARQQKKREEGEGEGRPRSSLKKSLSSLGARLKAELRGTAGGGQKAALPESGLVRDEQQARLVHEAREAKQTRERAEKSEKKKGLVERFLTVRKKTQGEEKRRVTASLVQLPAWVFCTECGKKNQADGEVCAACGEALEVLPEPLSEPAREVESPRRLSAQRVAAPAPAEPVQVAARQAQFARLEESAQRRRTVLLQMPPAEVMTLTQQQQQPASPRSPRDENAAPPVQLAPEETVCSGSALLPAPQGSGRALLLVETRDNHGGVFAGPASVEVSVRGPNNQTLRCEVAAQALGRYQAAFARTLAGRYVVTVRCNGVSVAGSPFVSECLPVLSVARSAVLDAAGALRDGPQAAEQRLFLLETRDTAGERQAFAGCTVLVRSAVDGGSGSGGGEAATEGRDRGDGTVECLVSRSVAGRYRVSVTLNGEAVPGSPFDFVVQPVLQPERTRVLGLGPSRQGQRSAFTVELADQAGAPVHEAAELRVSCLDPQGAAVEVRREGALAFSVQPQKWGSHIVSVELGSTAVPGSPFRFYAAPAVAAVEAEGDGWEDGPQSERASVLVLRLRDPAGQPLPGLSSEEAGLQVRVQGPAGQEVEVFVRDTADCFRARFKREAAGPYQVTVTAAGQELLSKTVRALPMLDQESVVLEVPAEAVQCQKELIPVAIAAKDLGGRPLAGQQWTLEWGGAAVTVRDRGSGSYEARLDATVPGVRELRLSANGSTVRSVRVAVTQQLDPMQTACEGAALQDGTQSLEAASFLIRTRDVAGQPMERGGALVAVRTAGPNGATEKAAVTDHGDGCYVVRLRRAAAGPYETAVSVAGSAVRGSPFRCVVRSELDANSVTVRLEESVPQHPTEPVVARMACRDIAGAPLSGQTLAVSVRNSSLDAEVAHTLRDEGNGEYTLSFGRARHGACRVAVAGQVHHVRIVQVLARATLCLSSSVPQSAVPLAGTVELWDLVGERYTEPAEVAVAVDGREIGRSLAFELNVRAWGERLVTATVSDGKTASLLVTVQQRVEASHTLLAGLPEETAQSREPLQFTVEARDLNGEPMRRGGDIFSATVETPAGPEAVALRDTGDGRYEGTLVPLQAGSHWLRVALDGREAAARELRVRQTLDPAQTAVVQLARSAAQSLEDYVTLCELRFVDVAGSPFLGDVEPDFAVSVPNTATAFIANFFSLVPRSAGQCEVTVRVAGVPLPQPLCLTVEQTVCAEKFEIDSLEAVSDGPQSDQLQQLIVQAMDLEGVPILRNCCEVAFAVEGPQGTVPTAVDGSAGKGAYVLSFLRSHAGPYSAAITVDGRPFRSFRFAAAAMVWPAQCVAHGPGLDSGGGAVARREAQFVIELREMHGALVPNASAPEVAVICVATAAFVEAKVTPAGDGTWSARYEPQAAGPHEVAVRHGGTHLHHSPYSVAVERPPKSGGLWQARFESEAEQRRRQREQERLAEIAAAKANFAAHAAEVSRFALERQEQELAERRRLREIEEHAERMRGSEGDAVRQRVLERVQGQAAEAAFEPGAADAAEAGAGKRWAAQQQREHQERTRRREEERLAEIAAAERAYREHLDASKHFVAEQERRHLEQEDPMKKI